MDEPRCLLLGDALSRDWPTPEHLVGKLLLPRTKMMIAGYEKTKKSFILHSLLVALATGRNAWGNPDWPVMHPVPGILFSQELPMWVLVEDRWKYHITPSTRELAHQNIVLQGRHREVDLTTTAGMAFIGEQVDAAAQHFGRKPAWIALDPISMFHTGDENEQKTVSALLKLVDRLADDNEASVIMVHHYRKPVVYRGEELPEAGGRARVRGSNHFLANMDTVIEVDEAEGEERFRLRFTTRHGKKIPDALLRFHEETKTLTYLDSPGDDERTISGERLVDVPDNVVQFDR